MGPPCWALISQAAPEPGSWIALLLGPVGLLVGLIAAVWAFGTRRVISRGTYDEMVRDRDRWRDMALGLLPVGEKVADAVEETVS